MKSITRVRPPWPLFNSSHRPHHQQTVAGGHVHPVFVLPLQCLTLVIGHGTRLVYSVSSFVVCESFALVPEFFVRDRRCVVESRRHLSHMTKQHLGKAPPQHAHVCDMGERCEDSPCPQRAVYIACSGNQFPGDPFGSVCLKTAAPIPFKCGTPFALG